MERRLARRVALVATLAVLTTATGAPAVPAGRTHTQTIQLAQAHGTEPRELEPRYQPPPPEERSWYNSDYIFGMTKSVARSTMAPGAKVPLFVLTVPLDLVFLPFAAIGGLFG